MAYTSLNCQNNYYYTNGTLQLGKYDDDTDWLPVIPCTESILFIADETATSTAGGKCAKTKYGDIYNTITSTFSYVITDIEGFRENCVDVDDEADDEAEIYKCLTDYYARMGGLAVATGPNYKNKKPNFVDVDYEESAEVSRVCHSLMSCLPLPQENPV